MMLMCCTTGNINTLKLGTALPDNKYSLSVNDDLSSKHFTLKLTSFVDRQSCVYFEDWPNKNGYLHFASDRVFMAVLGKKLPIKDRNLGYCVDGCYIEIPPKGTIESIIPYSEFESDIPLNIDTKKTLIYTVQPYLCDG